MPWNTGWERCSEARHRFAADRRREAIKRALVEKYGFDPGKFAARGAGWDHPADPDAPQNHAKNRRVEVSIYRP